MEFLAKERFDIYDTEATPSLPVPAEVERERNQVDALCKLMSEIYNLTKTGTTISTGYHCQSYRRKSKSRFFRKGVATASGRKQGSARKIREST